MALERRPVPCEDFTRERSWTGRGVWSAEHFDSPSSTRERMHMESDRRHTFPIEDEMKHASLLFVALIGIGNSVVSRAARLPYKAIRSRSELVPVRSTCLLPDSPFS